MARILALDYGGKRTGIATTDPLQIIATPLITVETKDLMDYLSKYISSEEVSDIVVGQPTRHDGSLSPIEEKIVEFIQDFTKTHPSVKIHRINEMYSSKDAMQALIKSGVKRMGRRDKKLLDSTAATLLLQEFLYD
ncbi:MAG: Holliday junction resolvase RuvX [Bacteroidia bacterium]|nr:Holliday junction resolvase RuvX [Bacteroidia bacterium]NNJ54594.1 Holliday junction resolvase RuvX [Bacteroidia bacterium]